jgi:hypothetical protein
MYVDNYYDSVYMANQLQEQSTGVCGTIRQNRGLPSNLKNHQQTLRKGEMTFRKNGEVLLFTWVNKTVITMKYTTNSAEMVEVSNKFCKK